MSRVLQQYVVLIVMFLSITTLSGQITTWKSGDKLINEPASYGTLNVASATNTPGARKGAVSWSEPNGTLWMFGGYGYDAGNITGYLNDLWKYNPTTDEWTWVGGSNTIDDLGTYGTKGISNSTNQPPARDAAAGWMDNNGFFWIFGGINAQGFMSDVWKYNTVTSEWTWVAGSSSVNSSGAYGSSGIPSAFNMMGSRIYTSVTTNGSDSVWFMGGSGYDDLGNIGSLNDLWLFNTATLEWAWMHGSNTTYSNANYGTKGLASAANMPGARYGSQLWVDSTGDVWLYGGEGIDILGSTGPLGDMWNFNTTTSEWTWIKGYEYRYAPGFFVTSGTFDSGNLPGARRDAISWIDDNGYLWLFGGYGVSGGSAIGDLNDYWKYDPALDQWAHVGGSQLHNISGIYGTKGIASSSNQVGGRYRNIGWYTQADGLWVFGGLGYGEVGGEGYLNDLWNIEESYPPILVMPSDTSFCEGALVAISKVIEASDQNGDVLIITAQSSNQILLPNSNISVTGIGQDSFRVDLLINPSSNGIVDVVISADDQTGFVTVDSFKLTVYESYTQAVSVAICQGDSVLISGVYKKVAGLYSDTLSSISGCDSIVQTNLTISPIYVVAQNQTICQGDSALLGGAYQKVAGLYSDTLSSVSGCDSVIQTNLTVKPIYVVAQSQTICQGDSALINGVYEKIAGLYSDTLSSVLGCDSIIQTNLTVNPVYVVAQSQTICQGDSALINGVYESVAGLYSDTLSSASGCDSVIQTNLIVNSVYVVAQSQVICQGDSALLGGLYQKVAGVYSDTLSSVSGCDSVIQTNLTVNPVYVVVQNQTICQGDSALINGVYEKIAGLYSDTLSSVSSCDSVIQTNLTVNPVYVVVQNQTICQGDSALINGVYEKVAGLYSDTLSSVSGCDSIIQTNLTVSSIMIAAQSQTICQGDSILLGGAYRNIAGLYSDTLSSVSGCDSVIQTSLIINPVYIVAQSQAICQGDSALLGGVYQKVSGLYSDTLSSVSGCDSVIQTSLTVTSTYIVAQSQTICQGDSAFLGGVYQKVSGLYSDTLSSVSGCDSVIQTNLIVYLDTIHLRLESICIGDSILLGGAYQKVAGFYRDTLGSVFGCDSIIQTNLTVNAIYVVAQRLIICQGDSVLLGGAYRKVAGLYSDTLSSISGCDSIIQTSLTVTPVYVVVQSQTICQGDSILLGGIYQKVAGLYNDTLSSASGCDSIIQTNLTVNSTYIVAQSQVICLGDSTLLGGVYQKKSGLYSDTLSSLLGCDSIIQTSLTVNSDTLYLISRSICLGDSLFLGGQYRKVGGVYTDSLIGAIGCDSVIQTTLVVVSSFISNVSINVCQGDSLFLEGAYQTVNGIYTDSFVSKGGCDSIVYTTLKIIPIYNQFDTLTICQGDSAFLGGVYCFVNGVYIDSLTSINGCDSLVQTTLNVVPRFIQKDTIMICQGDSVLLAGVYQHVAGVYTDSLVSTSGCDSLVETVLIIEKVYTQNIILNICQGDSAFLAGSYQTVAGVYTDSLSTQAGCDSIVETTLNIVTNYMTSISVNICQGDSFLINGVYEKQVGVYVDTLSSTSGCDSIINYTLSVSAVVASNRTVEICAGDSILINGGYVGIAGIYTEVYTSATGCDSIVSIDLSIKSGHYNIDTIQICEEMAAVLYGNQSTQAGVYRDTLTNRLGCDSILVTYLEIIPTSRTVDLRTICTGDSLFWRGDFYFEAGIYSDTLNSVYGCDSIVTLDLNIDSLLLPTNWTLDTVCLTAEQVLLPDTSIYSYSGVFVQNNTLTVSGLSEGAYSLTRMLKSNVCAVVDTHTVWVDSCAQPASSIGTHLPFIEALPTLNDGRFRVYLGVANTNNYTVRLIDRIGRVIGVYASEVVGYAPTLQEIDINEQRLSNGLYYIQLITDDQVLVAPIEIIR